MLNTNHTITLAQVYEIREEAEKATKGPLIVEYDQYNTWPQRIVTINVQYQIVRAEVCRFKRDELATLHEGQHYLCTHKEEAANARLFASSRTNITALCDLVDTLVEALRPVAAAITVKGQRYSEPDWNPDAHADEVILTVAEARAVLNVLATIDPQPAKPNASGGDVVDDARTGKGDGG